MSISGFFGHVAGEHYEHQPVLRAVSFLGQSILVIWPTTGASIKSISRFLGRRVLWVKAFSSFAHNRGEHYEHSRFFGWRVSWVKAFSSFDPQQPMLPTPPKKPPPPPPPSCNDFKTSALSPPLFSSESHKYNNYNKAPYTVSSYSQSLQANLFVMLFICPMPN